MKFLYKVQTDIRWSKFMFLVAWLYVVLTLFEPTHTDDKEMIRWDDRFTSLFYCELTIIFLLLVDFVVSFYHNYFDTLFRESAFFNTESLISNTEEKNPNFSTEPNEVPTKPVILERKRRTTLVIGQVKASEDINAGPQRKSAPPKSKLEISKATFSKLQRKLLERVRIFIKTFNKQLLLYKLAMIIIFTVGFSIFFRTYPNNPYRFSRYFRTILFPIYSKPTRRTLQAIFHSIKRIFDYFIFFFSIVFLYGFLGYKMFYDDGRTYYTDVWYDWHISDYNSYTVIVNSLMVLVTFDNYPMVMAPFYDMSPWYMLYFMPYIFVNILFFKPVPIAVVYDGFRVRCCQPGKEEQAHS